MMKRAGEFRRYAQDCAELGTTEVDPNNQALFLRLAENWTRLAELAENSNREPELGFAWENELNNEPDALPPIEAPRLASDGT